MGIIVQRRFNRVSILSMLMLALTLLALTLLAPSALARSQSASSLSKWLHENVIPELQELLSQHPRYQDQTIRINDADQNGLSEAIAVALNNNFSGRDRIALVTPKIADLSDQIAAASVDDLDCIDTSDFDYMLQVSTGLQDADYDSVELTLFDISSGAKQIRQWPWQGRFTSAERRQFRTAVKAVNANGSLGAPWQNDDVNAAAGALSRDFACALRPQITTRLGLQWIESDPLPALFADTANTTRHKLGDYRELGISNERPDYAVAMTLQPFRDDIWQLWLTGTPHDKTLAPVQAVTYFKSSSAQVARILPNRNAEAPTETAVQQNTGPALKFIDVQMIDATQADKWRSKADLQVTLRISNRAQQPIAYSFILSGGHFEQCIAEPLYYRHDHYGQLTGRLEAGASVMRRLVIENAQHRPTPLYGMPKCAGFRDLQGFEEFASQGYKVTDYVRWDM